MSHRIAILGFDLESNRFAPVATRADFEARWFFAGAEIDVAARAANPVIHGGICGFYAAMDGAAAWKPVPIVFAGSVPTGPVEREFFEELVADPLAQMQTIYEQLELGEFESNRDNIKQYFERRSDHKKNENKLNPELESWIEANWHDYKQQFGYH